MKNLFLFAFVSILTVKVAAQKCKEADVPLPVQFAFAEAYPSIKKTYWGKDSSNYVASFNLQKTNTAVTYDASGKRILTEREIPMGDLPKEIPEYMQKNYPGEKFRDVAQITNAEEKVVYEIQVRDLDVVFDAKGAFMQLIKCYEQ